MINQTTLSNGITVVTDEMVDVQTVSVGVYVDTGSRRETAENSGVAHYLEHMAFKGTTTRNAEQLAREIEDVGGYVNAYTSLETTAYYVRLMKEDLGIAVDVLADILCNSIFDETEMNRERGAILQEISMYKDSPDDLVHEVLREMQYKNQSVGRPILGTVENVQNMKADDLRAYMADNYHGNRMIIASAGAVKHADLVKMVEDKFASFGQKEMTNFEEPTYHAGEIYTSKPELEQAYTAYSWKGEGSRSPNYYSNVMMTSILGQGQTSPLYREVREKRGLAYSVYASNSCYKDHGTFNVYADTAKEHLDQLTDIVNDVVTNATFTQDALRRAQKGAAASIAMAMESSESRMERLASHMLTHRRIVPVAEALEKVYAVTLDDVQASRSRIINNETYAFSVVGPVEKKA